MADASSFSKLVPGFDFLESLVKNAGSALPSIGQWVAPTLNPEELEKRIEELKAVQFWLEQNARMLGATIQALEVQRMTLSTLKTMNVQMEDLRDSLMIRAPDAASPNPRPAAAAAATKPVTRPTKTPAKEGTRPTASPAAPAPAPAAVDPMQWWGALTRQFTELATTAMKDSALPGLPGAAPPAPAHAPAQPTRKPAATAAKKARNAAQRGAPRS
jgi:hypothetical protein